MFFDEERIVSVRQMILAKTKQDREEALNKILPYQKKDFIEIAPDNIIHLISENPYHSFAIIANAFYPIKDITAGVHPKAHVENSVKYDDTVQIAPGAVVSSDVVIGSNC